MDHLQVDLWYQAVQCFLEVLVDRVDQTNQQAPVVQQFPTENNLKFYGFYYFCNP